MENKQKLPQSTAISQASVQKSASISYAPQQSGTVIVPTTVRPDSVSDQRELPVDEMLESEYVALQEKQSVIQSQELSRKAQWTTLLSSVAVLSVLVLFMGGGFIANRVRQNVQQAQHIDIPEQSIPLDGLVGVQSSDLTDLGLKDGEKQLVVNGNIIAKGSVSLVSNNYLGQMSLATLTEGRIYTFPDASGTVCLNTNNCNYVSGTVVNSIGGRGGLIELGSGLELQGSTLVATNTAVTTSLDGATGTLTLSGGLSISGSALSSLISSVNGVSGTIVIQGSANQTNVITSGNVVTITTVQDIATSSSPVFRNLAVVDQTGHPEITWTNNQGFTTALSASPFITANRSISFPDEDGVICMQNSSNCGFATGGADAFLQNGNNFGSDAIFGTTDNFSLRIETNGLERLTVTNTGNVGINNTTASNRLSVNTLTTADSLATIAVATGTNTDKGLVIQGVASQSANLQEWQTSTGTVVASLASTGYFSSSITTAGSSVGLFRQNTASVDAYLDIYGGHNGDAGIRMYNPAVAGRYWVIRGRGSASDNFRIGTETSSNIITANRSTTGVGIGIDGGSIGAQLHVNSSAAATKGVIVRGTALQSANLQEWQRSDGAALALISANGSLAINTTNMSNTTPAIDINQSGVPFFRVIKNPGAGEGQLTVWAQDSTRVPARIIGAASQSANLQEWQNNTGTSLVDISSAGVLTARRTSGVSDEFLMGIDVGASRTVGFYKLGGQNAGGIQSTTSLFINSGNTIYLTPNGAAADAGLRISRAAGSVVASGTAIFSGSGPLELGIKDGVGGGHRVYVLNPLFVRNPTGGVVNLQEWQSSAGTALASVSATGAGSFVSLTQNGNNVCDISNNCSYAASSGSSSYIQNGTAIQTNANLAIQSATAGSVGIAIRGAVAQTANLQEWQNSAGTVLTSINANGALSIGSAPALTAGAIRLSNNSFITARNLANNGDKYLLSLDTGDNVVVGGSNSSRIYLVNAPGSGISIDTVASATGPGRGIYQGATSMGLFHYNGSISLVPGTASSFATVLTAARSSTNITIQTAATTDVGLAVRGVALQSANLQEWQNSAGTVVASVTSAGLIQANNGISTSAGNLNLNANGTYITIPSTKILTDDSLGNFIRLYVASAMEINGYRGVKISSRLSSSTDVLFVDATGLTTGKGLIVRSGASQTGNLTDWQNSAGVSLAYVTSGGDFSVNHDGNNTLTIQSSNSGSANIQLGASGTGPKLTYDPVVGALQISTGVTERLRVTNAGAVEINSTGTAGTVEKLRVNTPTTVDNLAATILSTVATTSKGLVIQGVASQTANLLEIQDSTAAVIGGWNSNGTILYMGSSSIAIRSNSGNLITSDWNSIHARSLRMPSGYTSAALQSTSGVSMLVWDTVTTNPAILVTNLAATQKALVVRGYASQTANLQEWQDDAGTAIAYISAGGALGASNSSLNVGYAGKGYRSLSVTQATRAADNDSYAVATFNATGTGDTYQNIGFNATMTGFNFSGSYGMTVRHSYTTTSAQFRVDGTKFGAGTASISTAPLGQVEIVAASASRKALVIQGAASQTADLLQWQNDSGTVLSGVTANGELFTGTTVGISNTQLAAVARTATNVATVARGASSQTADLNQWQDNTGTVLGGVTSAGDLYTGTAAALANTQLSVVSRAAGNVGAIVRGATSQTASLQEWQSDAGVVLASVSAAGDLTVVDATVNGTLTVNGDTTINGHIITGNSSGTTTVAAGAGAGAGAGVSISGNDTTGKITVTTGTGSTAGVMATVTFANAFANAPRVTLTPSNGNGASIQYFAGASGTTTFTIDSNNAPTDTTTYEYYYQTME